MKIITFHFQNYVTPTQVTITPPPVERPASPEITQPPGNDPSTPQRRTIQKKKSKTDPVKPLSRSPVHVEKPEEPPIKREHSVTFEPKEKEEITAVSQQKENR